MDSPYSITPQKCYHLRLGHFWFWSYYNVLLRMAAILDLSNMAATEGAHLGSLEKLVGDGHISPWSKNGACGTMWTIIWLSPLTIKIQLQMVRDRFIDGQVERALRRHLDSLEPNTPMTDIADCCRMWKFSHGQARTGALCVWFVK